MTTIAALKAGEHCHDLTVLCTKVECKSAKNGNPYLILQLQDQSGQIEGRCWDYVERIRQNIEAGMVVALTADISEWNGALQLNVKAIRGADANPADYQKRTPHDTVLMLAELKGMVDQFSDPDLRQLMQEVLGFAGGEWLAFTHAPAAMRNHHAYVGGLLEHTLFMARMGADIVGTLNAEYPDLVDHDRLISGVILHDLGKVWELSQGPGIDYTTEGRLQGHIALACGWLDQWTDGYPLLVPKLQHLILSHHGELEFGSPVKPQTPEAVLLHQLDMLHTRMAMVAEAKETAGEDGWTDWIKPLQSRLYFEKSKEGDREAEE